jgi:hypothetical protein
MVRGKKDLLKYNCGAVMICNGNISNITGYLLFQFKPKANKISLLCHNGTDIAKTELMELLSSLLNKNGWILEAADAVSWLLRKKEDVPIIIDFNKIVSLLDINNSLHEAIIMNTEFDKTYKTSYSYSHLFMDDSGLVKFANKETLFGTGIACTYDNDRCDRICINLSGGKFTIKQKRK